MASYGLPCECGAEITVTAGQAGGRVTCPRCARGVAVPKLRDLATLVRSVPAAEPPGGTWRPAHAVTLLGAIVCATSLAAAAWLGRGPSAAVDERALRAAVMAADDMAVYRGWSGELARATVRRPPADQELAVLRQARFFGSLGRGLSVAAAAGFLAALAGGGMLMLGPRRPAAVEAGAPVGRQP